MASDADFIIGTHAAWAGDIEEAKTRFKSVADWKRYRRDPAGLDGPLGLMGHVAGLRRRQFAQRKGELTRFARKRFGSNSQTAEMGQPNPLVLVTKNLRAVVSLVGQREYLLRAYLVDLKADRRVLAQAQRLSALYGSLDDPPTAEDDDGSGETPSESRAIGSAWVERSEECYLTVAVSCLCQIEASCLWIARSAAVNFETVRTAFLNVLKSLDDNLS